MESGFSSEDIAQIEKRGLDPDTVSQQIEIFERGNIVVNLSETANLKSGILALTEEEREKLENLYENRMEELDLLKFVPASGAATRMFKAFHTLLNEFDPKKQSLDEYLDNVNNSNLYSFFGRMTELPFYDDIVELIPNFESLEKEQQQYQFVEKMMAEDGLNLASYPKGLVPFHEYPDHNATAFEEHLGEAAFYAASKGIAKLHFTVAEDKLEAFKAEYEKIKPRIKKKTGLEYKVSYSFQNPKTDTIAVDMENKPFRDESGKLFFRPGGHGSLLENLNHQDADVIFIKNIDNVVIPKHLELVAEYKKVLGGKLLQLQEKIFKYLEKLEQEQVSEDALEEMIRFSQKELNAAPNLSYPDLTPDERIETLKRKLNRPLRVCGMVKNEGEPGGGPFWVRQKTGEVSLQIVESSQIDLDNYQQSKIAQEATHFNPVDIVCAIKNHKGKKFDLQAFVDPDTNFIANKTKDGRELKALEHPGLWNGGMAYWNTVFVEVPVETFNPVKTVADLLKPSHQTR